MGTWAIPNTINKAKKLKSLLSKPLYANDNIINELSEVYGDDDLFDEIGEYRCPESDIRILIKIYIKNLIDLFIKEPECFNIKFEKGALKILNQIVAIN